jgi:hypothetical protein
MKLLKNYRKAELNLSLDITKKLLKDWKVTLDGKIEKTVLLLNYFGFSTRQSCEGHVPPYKGVDTFRTFWPYVMVCLNQRTVFHLSGKDLRMEIIAANANETLNNLRFLVSEFTHRIHPFSASKKERYELDVVPKNNGIDGAEHPLDTYQAAQKHWNLHVLVCDKGVQGILTMPQEMLTKDFRKEFLERTQKEIEAFTKFLEWYAIEEGKESLRL